MEEIVHFCAGRAEAVTRSQRPRNNNTCNINKFLLWHLPSPVSSASSVGLRPEDSSTGASRRSPAAWRAPQLTPRAFTGAVSSSSATDKARTQQS